jgi:hypothetical protein
MWLFTIAGARRSWPRAVTNWAASSRSSRSGQAINVARNGNIVAAFTVDDIAWTEVQQRTFVAATAEIQRAKPGATPVLATTGVVTPLAAAEIGKRGWKIVHIKP